MSKMATSHILSAIEPLTGNNGNNGNTTGGGNIALSSQQQQQQQQQQHQQQHQLHSNQQQNNNNNRSPDIERNLNVTLDDRELWLRFQNLTNEMIVTKNGR